MFASPAAVSPEGKGRTRRARQFAMMCAAMACAFAAATVSAAPSVYPTGVTRYEPARAWNGYTVFSGQDGKTHLIDMNGNEVRQWPHVGFPPVLLDPALTGGKRGNILLQLANVPGAASGNGLGNKAIGELDWDGKVVWQWGEGTPRSEKAVAVHNADSAVTVADQR